MKMDEDEINEWYEEEKEKILEEYTLKLEEKKDREKAESEYHEKLGKVMEKYNKLMLEKLEPKKQNKFNEMVEELRNKLIKK
ncbi:MAG TPA: hypothetical protein VI564_00675 [Candidatus Nanoarchaeia archaeon]|nr:hypothetical protein [Candidatus Nanoarchaeia archaeon]